MLVGKLNFPSSTPRPPNSNSTAPRGSNTVHLWVWAGAPPTPAVLMRLPSDVARTSAADDKLFTNLIRGVSGGNGQNRSGACLGAEEQAASNPTRLKTGAGDDVRRTLAGGEG